MGHRSQVVNVDLRRLAAWVAIDSACRILDRPSQDDESNAKSHRNTVAHMAGHMALGTIVPFVTNGVVAVVLVALVLVVLVVQGVVVARTGIDSTAARAPSRAIEQ